MELTAKITYTFLINSAVWMLCMEGRSQSSMMIENLDSHGYLILELQDTSVGNWETGQYIVYQDNQGEIYTHPLSDKNAPGFKPPALAEESSDLIFENWNAAPPSEKKENPKRDEKPVLESNPNSGQMVQPLREGEKSANDESVDSEIVPDYEGVKKPGRRQKVQRVVPE